MECSITLSVTHRNQRGGQTVGTGMTMQPPPYPVPQHVTPAPGMSAPQAREREPGPALTYTVVSPTQPRPMLPMQNAAARPPDSSPLLSASVVRVLIAGAALIATVLGITLKGPFGAGWDAFTAWAIFAAVAAVSVIAGGATDQRRVSWPLQLYGTVGLVLFWLIAVRPIAVSDVGFLMTLGVCCALLSTARNPYRPPWRLLFAARTPRAHH